MPARSRSLPLVALIIACGSEPAPPPAEEPPLEKAESHLRVDFDAVRFETGRLIGWNLGRGTWYSAADDTVHPEWRTAARVGAIERLAAVRSAGGEAPWLRFSGLQIDGLFGEDGYHFWDFVDPERGVSDEDNMAVFQYMPLIEEAGGDPIVMLNYASGTVAEAADYARYLNGADPADPRVAARAHWGHAAPYDQRLFEIGNEVYAFWNTGYSATGAWSYANPEAEHGGDPAWHGMPSSDPAHYAARALAYVEAVSAVTPDARFWVPLSQASMESWGGIEAAIVALEPLLSHPAVEAVVIHHYLVDDALLSLGLTDHNDPRFLLGGVERFRAGFAELRQHLDTLSRPHPLQVAVTEYHVADGLSGGGAYERGDQAITGLAVADLLLMYAGVGVAHACQQLALSFQDAALADTEPLFDTWYEPVRRLADGSLLDMPSLIVVALIAEHLLGSTATVTVEAAPRASMTLADRTWEQPVLHAVAFAEPNLGSLLLLNRDLDQAREITIDLSPGYDLVAARQYAPPSYDTDSLKHPTPVSDTTWTQRGARVLLTAPPHSLTGLRFTTAQGP